MDRKEPEGKADARRELLFNINEFKRGSNVELLLSICRCLLVLGKCKWALQWAELIKKESTNASQEAKLLIAEIYRQRGDIASSWHEYKMLFRGAHSVEAVQGVLRLCRESNNHDFFERAAFRATKRYKHSIQMQLMLAFERILYKDFLGAWSNLQLITGRDPTNIAAWELAFECARSLKKYDTALSIAKKLISLSSERADFYDLLGRTSHLCYKSEECLRAYQVATRLDPSNLLFLLNSSNRCYRIAKNGNTANIIAGSLAKSAALINSRLDQGKKWKIDGKYSLIPYAFHAAYSPYNLRKVYGNYFKALTRAFEPFLAGSIADARPIIATYRSSLCNASNISSADCGVFIERAKLRIGFLSRYFYQHSNAQAFYSYFRDIDRSRFEVIVIHRHDTVVDPVHLEINHLADEVVYLDNSLTTTYVVLSCLDLNILFFTDIGMDPFDFLVPNMKACPIQITGWGLPHTSGLQSIDHYLSSSWIETKENQDEYSENLVLLEGLPCCFPRSMLYFRNTPRSYFFLPDHALVFGCVQSLGKIHPDLDLIIERISREMPAAIFAFMASHDERLDQEFLDRIRKRAPSAFNRTMLLNRCASSDFLGACNCFDILLDTPYYGGGITAYIAAYVGTPTVCFKGSRLRDSTQSLIYKHLGIDNPPVAESIPEYIDIAVGLGLDAQKRFELKRQIIESAHLLYDDQTFIRSFEEFCEKIA